MTMTAEADPYAYPTDCDLWNLGMTRAEYEAE